VRWELGGVVALAAPLFIVRHVYVQNLRLQQASRELLELMVKQIEARDPYTSGHSLRVSQYARILAREAGVPARQVEQIATAALLHDVGKVYEEYASLLQKEGRLTPEEKALLQTHPVRSAELVTTISSLRGPIEKAVRHHHENFDGTGYPDGLAGDAIPLGARIIMAADTLDAMTTDRPYRKALPFDRALEEIRKFSGKQFDPRLAEIVNKSAALRRHAAKTSPSAPASGPAAFERATSPRREPAAV
jgi:putative nucleotidyltransferase with HDIG domain